MEEIAVSVFCRAYNHEKYIRRCLDGFIMQKTNFKFEVLINDDASTDHTAEIIKEYEERYPDIIRPVYQSENQYSKGVKITNAFLLPKARGKYVATCEGDDYWIDEKKLQKQYDFLETHPEYSACVHCARYHILDGRGNDRIVPFIQESKEYSIDEIIAADGDGFATNSLFRRREVAESIPECFSAKGFGDYQAFMYSAICGKVYCMSDVMSVYNQGTEGSWIDRIWNNPQKRIDHLHEKIRMLDAVDKHYNESFHKPLSEKINDIQYEIYILEDNNLKLKEEPYASIHRKRLKQQKKSEFLTMLKTRMPWLVTLKRRIKKGNSRG